MNLADFGTTWTKTLDTESGEQLIVPTRELTDLRVDLATGHNAGRRASQQINELTALIQGGIRLLGQGPWILADIGSRDMKLVEVHQGHPIRMEWNNSCGAMTGFTLELLGRYFQLDFEKIAPAQKPLPVTCGVLGMERLFDEIASGAGVEHSAARFTRGMASFAHAFMDRPARFHLSGGMCDNKLFMNSFPTAVEVIPLGRFVLIEGLRAEKEQST